MASESRLYTFSTSTVSHLRAFRLTTSRKSTPQACIYYIDRKTLEILPENSTKSANSDFTPLVYSSLRDLADGLPENSPRFILLSYPFEKDEGRVSVPYVMLYYMPVNVNHQLKMLYAGAKELMASKSEVGRVIEVEDEEEVLDIEKVLRR